MPNSAPQSHLISDVRKALAERHLLSALQSLRGLAVMLKHYKIIEEVDSLFSSYHILLDYLAHGADDPERTKMYLDFTRRANELCDILEREVELTNDASFYTITYRTLEAIKGKNFSFTSFLNNEGSERNLFDAVFTSGIWTNEETDSVSHFLADDNIEPARRAMVMSAMTLSAMRFFDISKFLLLIDYTLSSTPLLYARAFVGSIFIHIVHPDRMRFYSYLAYRLTEFVEITSFRYEMEMMQSQLFLTLEAKRIERQMREDIVPQVMQHIKHLRTNRSLGLNDMLIGLDDTDLNPEWETDNSHSKLLRSINEVEQLKQHGADTHLASFKILAPRLPFFSVAANWFRPFTIDHPDLDKNLKDNPLVKLIFRSSENCDLDKYLICLSFSQINEREKIKAMDENIEGMLKELEDQQTDNKHDEKLYLSEVRSYVWNFYRFCTLFSHRENFVNPFKRNLFLADYPPFDEMLEKEGYLEQLADEAFGDKSYDTARTLYERIQPAQITDKICQKMGYCYEKGQNWEKAAIYYEQAHKQNSQSTWTLKHLATSLRILGRYEQALAKYNEIEQIQSKDITLAMRQAECLIHLERYEEAFKYLFKANYLSSDSANTARALAWCSLLTQKYEQAERYYTKVLADKPTSTDYLNAGHTAWLSGNTIEAVARYRKALPKENKENFLNEDAPMLTKAGLTADELAMMVDAVLSKNDE